MMDLRAERLYGSGAAGGNLFFAGKRFTPAAEAIPMSSMGEVEALFRKDTVNLRNPQDVELWTHTLNIYTTDLVTAVAAVGTSTTRVFEYLQQHVIAHRRARAPDSSPKADAD
jgi:hypothetical protein